MLVKATAWFQPDMTLKALLLILGVLLTVEGGAAYVVGYGGDPGKHDFHYNIDINDYLGKFERSLLCVSYKFVKGFLAITFLLLVFFS